MTTRYNKTTRCGWITMLFLLFLGQYVRADEGMWMLNNLHPKTVERMQDLGLELTPSELYDVNLPSLKNAVVSFGGFCTGVVVSEQGLLFTNHHCGFDAIQKLSTPENDLLKNGFVAQSFDEELPCADLYVSFLLRTENLTKEIQHALRDGKSGV